MKILRFLLPLFLSVALAQSTGVNGGGPNGGGGGGSTPGGSTNAVQYNAGAGSFGGVSLAADQLLQGSGATPQALSVPNCGSSSQALGYSTSSHSFGCQSITGSGPSFITSVRFGNNSRSNTSTPTCDNGVTTTITHSSTGTHDWYYSAIMDFFSGATAAGWKWSASTSVSGTGNSFENWTATWTNATSSTPVSPINIDSASDTGGVVSSTFANGTTIEVIVRIEGTFRVGTSADATVCIGWAQASSNASATALVSGSSMTLMELD